MSFRETYGQLAEDYLNKFVDDNLDAEQIKKSLHDKVDEVVDKYLAGLKEKLKANVIDQIDGQDDIPNI